MKTRIHVATATIQTYSYGSHIATVRGAAILSVNREPDGGPFVEFRYGASVSDLVRQFSVEGIDVVVHAPVVRETDVNPYGFI
jgi:hypothetical protein